MKIVTTFRMKTQLKEKLLKKYPTIQFSFQAKMGDAKDDLKDAEILITYGEDLDEQLIGIAKNLKWIMVLSAGIDRMPFKAIMEKGILVTNVRGIHKTPMAEYTMAMLLQVARKTKVLLENEKNEVWDRSVKMVELAGKTLTVIGAGATGSEIARLAKAFHMKTVGVNRSGLPAPFFDEIYEVGELPQALQQGDFIVSVLPSTPETIHLLKEEHFKMMKNESVFMNIGRGTVVEERVLIEALQQNEIAHAVLDVFENEPLKQGHPFWKMENVTVTPHLSGISDLYQRRGIEIFEYNLDKYLKGEDDLQNIIDLQRGY